MLPSCSFPDTRPATNTFSWHKNSISDGFQGITQKTTEIPAKRLGFPQIRLVPGKDAAPGVFPKKKFPRKKFRILLTQHSALGVFPKNVFREKISVWTLAHCEWRAEAPGLEPLRLLRARSSVQFRLKPKNSNSYGFELHRPSIKGTKLLLKVIKAIIIFISFA